MIFIHFELMKRLSVTSPVTPSDAGSCVTSRRNLLRNFCAALTATGHGESGDILIFSRFTRVRGAVRLLKAGGGHIRTGAT